MTIHSLRADLADAIARDLAATGAARVYGPRSTMTKVWNAAERAGRIVGQTITCTPERNGSWAVAIAA